LIDYWPLARKEPVKKIIIEKIPLFLIVSFFGYLELYAQKSVGATKGGALYLSTIIPFYYRIQNAIVVYVKYVSKLFYPHDLIFFYPYPENIETAKWLISLLLLLLITIFTLANRKRQPYLLTGWLWFLGNLAPMIGIIQAGVQQMALKYLYIPAIGIYMATVFFFHHVFQNTSKPVKRKIMVSVFLLILFILPVKSYIQTTYWQNTLTLTGYTLTVDPDNYMAHYTRALPLVMIGRKKEAIEHLQQAKKNLTKFSRKYAMMEQRINSALKKLHRQKK
jgi:hypothetical protein